jgi:signal transduction histidine kinase
MRRIFTSLRGQLTAAILAVLALGLGLLLLMAGHQMSEATMEAFTHEQQVMALALANTFPESFETRRAQQLMTAWVTHREQWSNDVPRDTNISMFTTRGALIASSAPDGRENLSPNLRGALGGGMASTIVGGRLYTAVPVTHEGRSILGVIQVDSSLDSVNARMAARWLTLIGAAVAALLFACVIALWLAAQLTHPLSELRGVAQQMSEGQLDARVELGNTAAELASLGATFNHMADQIENMIQEQRDFVANASHELRAPLAAVKLRAEALASQTVDGERARQYVAEIEEDVARLARLVEELLQLSRAESGVFAAPAQSICVADTLYSCVRAAQPRLASKHQQFEVDLPDDLPDMYMHSNDLCIMVGNLLDNAIKYTPEGGKVSLSAAWRADRLDITVSDTGEGIPPAYLPRVSERFFRVDRAHTRHIAGVGLGLALVAALARQYCGVLRINSSGVPGQGTQAHLELATTRHASSLPAQNGTTSP